MKLRDYNSLDHLEGTMFEFGRYRLVYDPPIDSVDAEVKMTISAEASLPQMLNFFSAFLRASGYVFEGELEIATGEEVEELVQDRDFWQEQTYKLLRPEE